MQHQNHWLEEVMKVGFIGLGSMGGDQAGLLARNFDSLTVYDVSPKAMAAFEGKATLAKSLADAARDADVVGVCVRDDAQVNESVDGLLPAMKPGSVLLIHSTIRPSTAIAIAARADKSGVSVLDAPVTRTVMGKDGPFVFCMTGGDEGVARRVKPVLDAFSTDTLHVGPLGAALALKISNNLVSWVEILVGMEAFRIAEAAGVSTESLMLVMQRNGCLSPPMKAFIQGRARAPDPEFSALMQSQAGIGEKDIGLAETLGRDVGAATPLATYAHGLVYGLITEAFKT